MDRVNEKKSDERIQYKVKFHKNLTNRKTQMTTPRQTSKHTCILMTPFYERSYHIEGPNRKYRTRVPQPSGVFIFNYSALILAIFRKIQTIIFTIWGFNNLEVINEIGTNKGIHQKDNTLFSLHSLIRFSEN